MLNYRPVLITSILNKVQKTVRRRVLLNLEEEDVLVGGGRTCPVDFSVGEGKKY